MAFPQDLDVFIELLDGYHPIVAEDLNDKLAATEAVQKALGYGTSPAYGGLALGPKGLNASVRARLDSFLTPDGGPHDVAFVTGTIMLAAFDETTDGALIVFGKSLVQPIRVLFQAFDDETEDAGGGVLRHNLFVPAWVWIADLTSTYVTLRGRTMHGYRIGQGSQRSVRFALLALGAEATVG